MTRPLDLITIYFTQPWTRPVKDSELRSTGWVREQTVPVGSIESAHGINAYQLMEYLSSGRTWDLVHMAMFVDARSGDLLIPDPDGATGASSGDRLPSEGVEGLIKTSGARLVVIVTCDSLALGARIARTTNTIAGHKQIDVRAALGWSAVFYRFLAQGCPLSEAFNRAQTLTDPGLVLLAKRDFRLKFPTDRQSS